MKLPPVMFLSLLSKPRPYRPLIGQPAQVDSPLWRVSPQPLVTHLVPPGKLSAVSATHTGEVRMLIWAGLASLTSRMSLLMVKPL